MKKEKVKCLICGKEFIQVCSHIHQIHNLTAREYKIKFGLDVKKGLVPEWYSKLKAKKTFENGTVENLKNGAKFRFKKGAKNVGVYKRSPQTLSRLSNLWKLVKRKKNNKKI